jgi:type I restriction enzyme S subunit
LYFKDGNVIWFQNNNAIDGGFFYYSFIGKAVQKFIKDSSGTSTVGTYTIDSGRKTPIFLPPTRDEQIKIASLFKNIDELLTLHQRKLKHLQEQKKALLQQMFI